jgi:GntR family transcriptional repressor for pyruvate dehydrogenase complex
MNDFSPIHRKAALAEEIARRILSLITDKKLRPGDKLPSERELMVMLGVSRPSLREALRALSMMRVIEMRQGDGNYVSSLEPESLVEHLNFVYELDDSTLHQLFEARKVVESGIAALAAQRISEEQIAEMEAALVKSGASVGDPQAFLQADVEFHDLITRIAANPILSRVMTSIRQLSSASRARTGHLPGITRQSVEDHRLIVEALKHHDSKAASEAMLAHLDNVERRLNEAK